MDSGVNEHIIGLSSTFSDLHPLECPRSVSFTNRSLAKVAGLGSTQLSDSLSLYSSWISL